MLYSIFEMAEWKERRNEPLIIIASNKKVENNGFRDIRWNLMHKMNGQSTRRLNGEPLSPPLQHIASLELVDKRLNDDAR